ncbi:MAG: TlyA family RNA methyltransferase [Hyphomicrobiaceae bacterium]
MSTLRAMRQRLDKALVARGLVPSRARGRDLVRRGLVCVDGRPADKAGLPVSPRSLIDVIGEGAASVSRGSEKLRAALDYFGFDAAGRVALDVGAGTGGFTEVLLARGAVRVYAVDVGSGQLHTRLAGDPRVVALESVDARTLGRATIPETIDALVADVGFISLTKALPAALALTAPGCWLAALVKPQFEAGRAAVGKGGVVRDAAEHVRAVAVVRTWLETQTHWRVLGAIPSPIAGKSGNREFLLGAVKET